MEFASTPPPLNPSHFIPVQNDWGKTYSAQQFPMFDYETQFLHLNLMCLASLVNRKRFIKQRCAGKYGTILRQRGFASAG